MRKPTAFVIALSLGMASATVLVEHSKARAGEPTVVGNVADALAALLFPRGAYPDLTEAYTRGLYALNHGNKAAYKKYRRRLVALESAAVYLESIDKARHA